MTADQHEAIRGLITALVAGVFVVGLARGHRWVEWALVVVMLLVGGWLAFMLAWLVLAALGVVPLCGPIC